jgi:hypothetical protein
MMHPPADQQRTLPSLLPLNVQDSERQQTERTELPECTSRPICAKLDENTLSVPLSVPTHTVAELALMHKTAPSSFSKQTRDLGDKDAFVPPA